MPEKTSFELTSCQALAKAEIEAWLLDESAPEFILSGGAGVGKSTLLDLILKDIDQVNDMCELLALDQRLHAVVFTATTNKAASVINGVTIFSLLGITIYNDYKTGEVKHNTKSCKYIGNTLVVVDESSMLDDKLLAQIRKLCTKCKILYVGDRNQLYPVGLTYSPVFDSDIPSVHMTTQCRQKEGSHLYSVICGVRDWVETGVPCALTAGPGVTYIDDAGLVDFIGNPGFGDKIITFTNRSCTDLNKFVRFKRNLPIDFYKEGELVLSATTMPPQNNTPRINMDAQYTITNIGPELSHNGWFNYREVRLNSIKAYTPTNSSDFAAILKQLKAQKKWREYFSLKESYVELRDAYTITVHKSQGSSYDRVLINLTNFKRCPDKDMLSRLLYVAISRARTEVYLYGNL